MPCPLVAAVDVPAGVARVPTAQAPRRDRGSRRVAAWLLIAAVGAVAAADAGPGAEPAGLDAAWTAVEALVGTPRCRADSDCRSIGVGSRACGGPERYLAWSTQVSDAAVLGRAVARHAALRQAADEKVGRSSVCVLVEEPAVQCRRADGQDWGVCVAAAVSRGPGRNSTQR